MAVAVGDRIGRYRIEARLGAGGMGEVWRALDERLGRRIAIKVLPPEFATDADRLRRFEQEARATAALSHPNILAIHDVGLHDGAPYIVEELLEGETLREWTRRERLPWRRSVEIAVLVADGLAAAHDRGIVHRDLKPENVFITGHEVVKILDFGVAKLLPTAPGAGALAGATTAAATEPHAVLGTADYMAPEQIRGEPVDGRADVFALGCVLYEMLGGRSAFRRGTAAETMAAVLHEPVTELSRLDRSLPAELEPIVAHCLEKPPGHRFQSARDLSFALRTALAGPSGAGPSGDPPPAERETRPSIAVLPFANLSGDADQEYFCDGTAEEIINALAHVEGLRVVARTSSFAFKGRAVDIREVGRSLDVGAVLEGSVRRSGDRLRVMAQLINVSDGCHLWSERFDRRLEDVFAIQDEIALAVTDNLRVKLLSGERASVVRRHTESFDAHNTYLMGMYEWNKMSPEGFARCHARFREAIRLDPGFARAYAQLADALSSTVWWADQEPAVALEAALPLVKQALALDEHLAHAHSVLGQYRTFFERNWTAGERSMRRAVALAPNDALAQTYLGTHLVARGRHEEAVERARLAQRLDPLSPAANTWNGMILAYAGRFDEGLAALEKQVAATPLLWMPHYFLSLVLAVGGRTVQARAEAEKAVELSGGISVTISHLGALSYRLGDRARGDGFVAQLEERAGAGYVSPMLRAVPLIARGDIDEAIPLVERALAANDPWVSSYRLIRIGHQSDPRIEALVSGSLD